MEIDHGLIIGGMISLISSIISTLGYAVQKMGHMNAIELDKHYVKEPFWILGMFLIISSVPIFSFSLMFASQTAMSMIPTLSILFIMGWSWLLLNERLGYYDFLAISLLTPGTAVILLSSDVVEAEVKSNAFKEYIFSDGSIMFLSLIMGLFIIGGIVSMHILKTHEKMSQQLNYKLAETEDRELDESKSGSSISVADIMSYRWNLIPMLYLPWFAGLFCCLASTLVKSLFMIYKETARSHGSLLQRFGEPDAILIGINVIILSFISFYLLNKSLQYFEPLYILPFEKVSLLINTLLGGGIILKEFKELSLAQVLGFITGTLLGIIGVVIFLWKKDQSAQMKDFIQEEVQEHMKIEQKNKDIEMTNASI